MSPAHHRRKEAKRSASFLLLLLLLFAAAAFAADPQDAILREIGVDERLHPHVGGDAVRPDIALYGSTPVAGRLAGSWGLAAAMSLTADVLSVH